ncbi:DUF2169 family type VI secretion system accessory protein [Paraburkholderia haematera]|uniref:DUF2169 domain-containing protein n=1 Tax=Paraburkholderia haematera TaxID=2793077 RepID=A0ABN7LXM1_9BURK|nr:DUF2169 domain-containing protein [Paraburkholderia haematera]CAE6774515.1 hypothetical protein R69888_04010 [Paraburkholderia haematera]
MKIIKPTPLGILTRAYRSDGREYLGIAIPMMATLGETPRLVGETELWDTVGDALSGYTLDAALPKPHAEFLVSGHAYGKYCGRSHVCHVGIRFAGIDKQLRVSGDRYWTGGMSRAGDEATAAEPFESLPIDWPLAYGGAGYADNPRGRGFATASGDRATPRLLPNIEYAADLIHRREQRIEPASFTPIAPDWPPRSALLGQFDQPWREADCPGFPRTIDHRYFNVAPLDQQLSAYTALPDGAAYEITHMHPERAVIAGRLPALRARCFVQRQREDALAEVPMRLTTAWFIPHRERVVMIFHGAAEVEEFDAQDIACLMIGAELNEQPLSAMDYRRVFDLRMDSKRGALHALRDRDLVPVSMLVHAGGEDETTHAPSQSAVQRNLLRRAQLRAEQAAASAHGPAAQLALDAIATAAEPKRPPRLDELAEFVQQQEQQAEEQRATLETMRQQIEAKHAASLSMAPARRGPPPSSITSACLARTEQPALLEMARAADHKLREAYLHAAHYQDAAPRLDPAAADTARRRVAAMYANGESLAGLDLTGADLSGMNLRGAQLSGVLLESANLTGADFSEATLTSAVLVRATLLRARFARAQLTQANLSLAQCEDTDFSEATLDRSLFEHTHFLRCRLPRASIHRAQFRHCRFDAVDFNEAKLADLVFMEQTFHDVSFNQAHIRKLAFIQCRLERASFTEADIVGLGFVETDAKGVHFDRASLRKACFVKDSVLTDADFTQARLTEVNLRQVSAQRANFSGARISQCDFSDACLEAANLQGVKLDNGYMVRTDLSAANLARADLIGGYLRRANLRGTNLREANLFRANLAETSMDRGTQLDGAYLEQTVLCPLSRSA